MEFQVFDLQEELLLPKGPEEFSFDSKAEVSDEFMYMLKELTHIPNPDISQLRRYEDKRNNPFDQ